MQYGYFDDAAREYVITEPRHAFPLDQLSGQRGFFYPDVQHGRRLQLLQGRAHAASDSLPLQQRAHRRRRTVFLHQRRRRASGRPAGCRSKRRWIATSAATASAIPVITGEKQRPSRRWKPRWCRCGVNALRSRKRRTDATAPTDGERGIRLLQLRGVLPVERAGRRDQLPAQLLHRRGRGRGQCHLSQDGIPRAPQPLCRVRGQRATCDGFDTDRERFLGAVQRLWRAARRV